jgi:hypothetical protein
MPWFERLKAIHVATRTGRYLLSTVNAVGGEQIASEQVIALGLKVISYIPCVAGTQSNKDAQQFPRAFRGAVAPLLSAGSFMGALGWLIGLLSSVPNQRASYKENLGNRAGR